MSRRRRPLIFLLHEGAIGRVIDGFSINKRQRFLIAVIVLSALLFASQYILGKSGILFCFFLSFLTVLFFWLTNYKDIKHNFSPFFFVLPFFYSLAFGLFYFLVPDRFVWRVIITSVYAGGLYSLFLSENIFIVASMRTIALFSSAKTVSFIITIFSYLFLTIVILSLEAIPVLLKSIIIFTYTFFLIAQSFWSYTLEKVFTRSFYLWVLALSLCFFEFAIIFSFWPSDFKLIALFLTGLFYTFVGLSHVWMDKRLFRSVLWEYIWVSAIVFVLLFLFTNWRP